MASLTVVYDASVLYPAPLRDFLMWLALTDLFKARWTNQIHEEWITSLLRNRPDLSLAKLERTRILMNTNVRDCLVEGYETLINSLELPDPDDLHVLAAAIHCQADLILTFNLKDFPSQKLANYCLQAVHPDVFITELINLNPQSVCHAAWQQLSTLKNPPLTLSTYLETLNNIGLKQTSIKLETLFKDYD